MPLDADYVLGRAFPVQEASIGSAQGLLYAVALGLGEHPDQPWELSHVYEQGQKLFPTIAVLLGHPGNWMEDPRTGITRSMVMHGGQEIIIHAPLAIDRGLRVVNRVAGLIDKGPGRSAILQMRREISTADDGTPVATLNSTVVCRADGGFGGSPGETQPQAQIPDTPPSHRVELPISRSAALLYRLTGDRNPLHVDPARARKAGFARPPLHGLCSMGMAARAVLNAVAPGQPELLRRIGVTFAAPVFPGETLIVELWPDTHRTAFRARVAGRDAVVLDRGFAEFGPVAL